MEQSAASDATDAAAAEVVAAGSNVEAAVSSANETLDASKPTNAVSSDGVALPSGTSTVDEVQNASGTGQTDSDPIIEFSSQETLESSSQDSINISQFSDESQSVLCNIYGSVTDQSNDDTGVVVLEEGQAPSSSGDTHDVEDMDSSVSLKRAREEDFVAPARPSRHRSHSGDSRKKSRGGSLRGDSSSRSPSAGRHSRLPPVVPASPRKP